MIVFSKWNKPPRGPAGASFPVSNGRERPDNKVKPDHRDKKHYAGTLAGIGRGARSRISRPFSPGTKSPVGPGNAVFPTSLPRRAAAPAAAPKRASLVTRLLGRAKGLFGR
jgi:hypothetical protein